MEIVIERSFLGNVDDGYYDLALDNGDCTGLSERVRALAYGTGKGCFALRKRGYDDRRAMRILGYGRYALSLGICDRPSNFLIR